MSKLAALLQQLRLSLEAPPLELEPDVDEKTGEDGGQIMEDEELQSGAVLKATLEAGEGGEAPKKGDLVYLHYIISNQQEQPVYSTHVEHGGSGHPQPLVLGQKQTLRGLELAVMGMTLREHAVLNVKPHFAYKHKDCRLAPPPGLRRDEPVVVDVVLVNFYPASGVKSLGKDGSVIKRTLEQGEGWETPRVPFEVSLHLTMCVPSTAGRQGEGQKYFASSPGNPLTCALGSSQLPPGVETALQSMQRQEKATVCFPASLARGAVGVPQPPGQPQFVECQVQLLDFTQVRDLTGDQQVIKHTLRKGTGEFPVDCPLEDSAVQVHLRIRQAGASEWLLDTRQPSGSTAGAPLEFETGMGAVPEALDQGVRLMLRGEVSSITSSWKYCYQGRQDAPEGLSPEEPVEFELELVGFEAEPNWTALSAEDKLARAKHWKERGNTLYLQTKYPLARAKYQKAIKMVGQALDLDTQEQFEAASALKVACLLNLVLCAQREQQYGEAISWSTKAISEDDQNAKAYFRRSVARSFLGQYAEAAEDLETAKALDASLTQDVDKELARQQARQRVEEARSRSHFANFLQRG